MSAAQLKREGEERRMDEEKRKKEAEREELCQRMIKREQEAEEKLKQREQQMFEEQREREGRSLRSDDADRNWRRNASEQEKVNEKENTAPKDVYRPPGRSGGSGGRNMDEREGPWRDKQDGREDNYDRGGRDGRQTGEETRRGGDWREDGPRRDWRDDGARRDDRGGWRQKEEDHRERWGGGSRDHDGLSWRGGGRNESDRSPRPGYDGDRRRGEDFDRESFDRRDRGKCIE